MAEAEGESLESWLNKATNPSNRQEDWEYIIGFCDQINKELEGPQIAVRLLAHKIQSPQEWEAVQALTVLEACMKNCGRRLHNEVGKFRFLNELIKVVSPKYLGDRVSEKVKTKVIELLFSWTLALPEEAKIKDAYHMLKRQGIVQSDPPIPMDRTLIPSPPPRPKNPVFDDEEKSKLLARLLKSKNPDDLQEANRLIKSMVKEDEARIQKVTKRLHTLEEVNNNVKLLHEMLLHYSQEYSSEADKELMKELFDRCENKRRTLFKLASETEDNDNGLGDILQASDNLSRVINSYKTIIEGQIINGEVTTSTMPDSEGLTDPAPTAPKESPGSNQWHLLQNEPSSDLDFFTPRLVPTASCPSDGPQIPPSVSTSSMSQAPLPAAFPAPVVPAIAPTHSTGSFMFSSGPVPALVPKAEPKGPEYPSSSTSNRLDALDQLLEEAKVTSGLVRPVSCFSPGPTASPLLPASAPARPLLPFSTGPGSPLFQSQGSPQKGPELSLASVHVPLESIKPSSALPVTAYDKNGFRILFHFAKECPPGRPDVLVVVVSMLNTAPLPVKSIVLQAAVPKSMKVKLQPPSGTELSPFSPLQPPAAITQVMLLANPMKEKVRLRYKLTFALGEQLSTELGEVDQFPPVEQWGNL
ncbi:ADP-ribosylation factor-binding protein GGA3 isoform X2 [Mus pahari]|uniref:ADP-ribosylation factor-binding protein GGA3 isoform X2 n=1 Tax=Mus pahari TaxID=10093 RepID=UPI000A309836|nr:ADP-ribosylation factor-binding protein GGA3 isoform X2 [Mus pahari]